MRQPKYTKGTSINSIAHWVQLVLIEKRYIYFEDKPIHPSFLSNWGIGRVNFLMEMGYFAIALPNPDHPENKGGADNE